MRAPRSRPPRFKRRRGCQLAFTPTSILASPLAVL
jgi:hypothetical protein